MRPPDMLSGDLRTSAWHSRLPEDIDLKAHISSWMVNGPFHPAWSWWVVGAVHLLDVEGVEPAHRQYPEAEYELMIVSLDPEAGQPDPDAPDAASFLTPPDLIYQCHGVSREVMAEIAKLMVIAIVEGRMSPDSDYRARWKTLLDGTVDHYQRGVHPPPAPA